MSNIIERPSDQPLAQRPNAGTGALAGLLAGGRAETAKALTAAITACHAVEKDATNKHHGYKYASADEIIKEGRKALASAGLALLPMEASLNGSERTGQDRYELVRTFVLLHTSGEVTPLRVVWPVCEEKGRPLDKATAIADTLSLSYLLRDLLLMARVAEGDDMNARDDRPREQPRGASQSKAMDGAEFAARIARKEAQLAQQGRCQPGELIAHLRQQGELLGEPAELVRWSAAGIKSARDWVRTFDALHPAPAVPAPSAANGTAAPAAPARLSDQQLEELLALMDRKGGRDKTWRLVKENWNLPRLMRLEDMPAAIYLDVHKALSEEPDRQPART